jgi:hypothetical protein
VAEFRRLVVEECASLRAEKALARRLRAERLAALGQADTPEGAAGDEEMAVQ